MSGTTSPVTEHAITCYIPEMVTTNGINQGDNPLDYAMPLFLLQIALVVITTRIIIYILKPLRQPRIVAEILTGFILGPSVLGKLTGFTELMFPLRSVMVLETVANIGLLYSLFIIGVEMELSVTKRAGTKGLSVALGGMILPFLIGCSFPSLLPVNQDPHQPTYVLFLGIALSVTSFPVLARVLADVKLINTNIGQIAMSSALINDISAWVLLILAVALSGSHDDKLVSLWVLLSILALVLASFFVVRPIIARMIRRTPGGEPITDFNIYLILTGVMIFGFVTDAIGTHSTVGAFIFGLIIPNGPLGVALIERIEDCVSGLLLPLFFSINGLKTDVSKVAGFRSWINLILAILLAYAGKVLGTVGVASLYNLPFSEGAILGLLMNTKGLVELIVLNVGRDQQALDQGTFSVMMVAVVLMTGLVGPLVNLIYGSRRGLVSYKQRSLESTKPDSELRIISCIHATRNVPTMLNLLEITHPTKRSPLYVYILHLIELTGRASAMLIVHNTRKSSALNRTQAQSEHIFSAFETYEHQEAGCVTVQPLTAISPYSSMHEDVCSLAEDKRISLIILPFHKHPTVDGGMESTNPALQSINQNMLDSAPCSVGILVDKGPSRSSTQAHVLVLFFNGRDDREALAYALRISDHPGVSITVMRLMPAPEASRMNSNSMEFDVSGDRERQLDEEYLNEFRVKTAGNGSIAYVERVINSGEDIVGAIRSLDRVHDLYVVGRGKGTVSPLTATLLEWSENPELGPIGDLLASSNFGDSASVLVLQQYVDSQSTQGNIAGVFMCSNAPFSQQSHNLDGCGMNNKREAPMDFSL